MIVKMMKYDIVLLSAEYDRFIETLRETGMVDITSCNGRFACVFLEHRTRSLFLISTRPTSILVPPMSNPILTGGFLPSK